MSDGRAPVAVVGAGVAGLACAVHLQRAGVPVRVFEASDDVGGRVRTDAVDGFLIDRGFQVLPTAYPEVQRMLDLSALRLGCFLPGALVRRAGAFARFADPLRAPRELFATLSSGVLSPLDLLRLLRLRSRACRGSLADLYARPESEAGAALRELGFSERSIANFFRPFFAGVFLERELVSSSRFLEFALRTFALGDAALPAEGICAAPRQLRAALAPGVVRTSAAVEALEARAVRANGERFEASAIVVAVDGADAHRLLPELPAVKFNATACLSFAADAPPLSEPLLVLDGERTGPVNHLCVPSNVAASYAPAGKALISASLIGSSREPAASLERDVRAQLAGWFGSAVARWELLRVDRVERALPCFPPGRSKNAVQPVCLREGVVVCGDHRELPSLQGALASGRRAAREVAAQLGLAPAALEAISN